jgi:hypothetical protein
MQPGTIVVLEIAGHTGEKEDPYWAVLSCPGCGTPGLFTRKQTAGWNGDSSPVNRRLARGACTV